VFDDEPLGDRHRLLILDLPRQPAPPFGVREPLTLESELAVGARDGFLNFRYGNFQEADRLTHLAGEGAQIGRTCGSIQGSAERVPQALEHSFPLLAQLLRIVFAKNGDSTGSTERDEHLGHASRREPCSAIDSVRAKCASHFVQRYSYSGIAQ